MDDPGRFMSAVIGESVSVQVLMLLGAADQRGHHLYDDFVVDRFGIGYFLDFRSAMSQDMECLHWLPPLRYSLLRDLS